MARLAIWWVALSLLLAPAVAEATRNREPLESFELSSLRYVAREVSRAGVVAIVVDPTGVSHRVVPGNYLGKNDGRVTVVKAAELMLSELYPDGRGGWYERPTALPIAPRD